MRWGMDYLTPLSVAEVKAQGASFVARYAKNLSSAEAKALSAAGIDLVLVHETTGHAYEGGMSQGELEAHQAVTLAAAAGMVGGHPIYFAPADLDISTTPRVTDGYFMGVAKVLPLSRIGVYGGYAHVKHVLDTGLASYAWQTYAWSGGMWDPRAQLQQYDNSPGAFDRDRAPADDFGQWRYGIPVVAPAPVAPAPVLHAVVKAAEQSADPFPFEHLKMPERAVVNSYVDAQAHPKLKGKQLRAAQAQMLQFAQEIYLAATQGLTPDGEKVELGWNVRGRVARYWLLLTLSQE